MSTPILSVVICTYNRDQYLPQCLSHLKKQSAPFTEFEVIVVDNNSTDATPQICKEFSLSCAPLHFSYLVEPQQGLSFARNLGMNKARGALISYLDDDAFVNPHYVKNLCKYFTENSQVDAVGGKIIPVFEGEPPNWMSPYLLPLVAALDLGDKPRPFGSSHFPIGANMAFKTSVLKEMQGFNTDLGRKGSYLGSGEEKDLFYRMHKQGKSVHYLPDIEVRHMIPVRRTEANYIREMAQGIGQSEAIRVRKSGGGARIAKWLQEFLKIGATVILAFYYTLTFRWPKASMLIKFRIWVLDSFIKG